MTTLNLSVEIDGISLPLHECDWVLRRPCGCAESIMHAVTSLMVLTSEDEAWREFYCDITRAARRRPAIAAARKRGYTVALMSIADAIAVFEASCPHGGPATSVAQTRAFDPTDPADNPMDVSE